MKKQNQGGPQKKIRTKISNSSKSTKENRERKHEIDEKENRRK